MFFNQSHPNGQNIYAWKPKASSNKSFDQKIKKYSHFQTVTTNNSKHFLRFHTKKYWQFQEVTTKWYYTRLQSSYQTLTLSESYYPTRVNTFSDFITNITDTFRELLPNSTTHFLILSSNIDIFREFIPRNNDFFRVHIKQ